MDPSVPAEKSFDDPSRWSAAQRLFEEALDHPSEARQVFVRETAGDDTWLAHSVLDLLARDQASSPLDRPLRLEPGTGEEPCHWNPGDRIAKYRLLERLGAGGMGTVFRAEHSHGEVRQEVAIKVLHHHLSSGLGDRFVQEQRILAGLSHPRISRLQDFGVTEDGTAFLVMNLVHGRPITDYADRAGLSIGARLRLFLKVCDAVSYAHRRLVVHRDLKPANILVTMEGEVQLVDFGIAKVLDPQNHLSGDATHVGSRVMTPNYASPEQLLGQEVTTGTDVWALGVLLYELLTGLRPFRWAGKSHLNIERELRLGKSPKASRTFGQPNDESRRRAEARGLDPRRLRRRLRGDLELVIQRALAIEPENRYGSVEAFARDLERYLDGRPILARPGWAYRAQKFFRRHAIATTAAATAVLLLVAFVGFLVIQSERLTRERDFARRQRDKAELMTGLLTEVLELANPSTRDLNLAAQTLLDQSKRRILAELSGEPTLRADLLTQMANLDRRLGDFDEAEKVLHQALQALGERSEEPSVERALALDSLGFVYHQKRDPRALDTLRRALRELWRVHRGDHPDIAGAWMHTAMALRYRGDLAAAQALLQRAHEMDQRLGIAETAEAGDRLADLAALIGRRGDRERGLLLIDRAIAIQRRARGPDSVQEALSLNKKALFFQERPGAETGAELLEQAIQIFERRLGPDHPLVAGGYHNVANSYLLLGRLEKAEHAERQAWDRDSRRLGADHPSSLEDRQSLAMILREQGRLQEAELHLREVDRAQEAVLDTHHPNRIMTKVHLSRVLLELGEGDRARLVLRDFEAARASLGPDHWVVGAMDIAAAEAALEDGNPNLAAELAKNATRIFEGPQASRQRWRKGEAESVLGAALLELGQVEAARAHLHSAVSRLQELLGPSVATRLAQDRRSKTHFKK